MGCCVQNGMEIKRFDLVISDSYHKNVNDQDFMDLSLSSDDDIQRADDWIAFKSSESKSLTDSLAMMSTLLQSDRKISVYSKPGSMVDSFSVNLPMHK